MADRPPEPRSEASHDSPPKSPFSEQGGNWENAGRFIGRFAGRAGSLFGKASEAVRDRYGKAQQREGESAIQKIWDQARDFVKQGTDKENVARLKELASLAKANTSDLSTAAAERMARIYNDCTGQPVTAAEVKQVALRFGMMALVTFVTASVLGRAGAAQNLFARVRDVAASASAGDEAKADPGDSFEERTARFYASEDGAEGIPQVIDAEAVAVDLE